jgi:hypothetical protein
MLRHIAQAHLTVIRTALAPEGTLQQRLERLFRAFTRHAQEESASFNVYMSPLYGVNHAFKTEAPTLLRDDVPLIALMLEQGLARGEIPCHQVESTALMALSLTESYALSTRLPGQHEQSLVKQASSIAELVLRGIGTTSS